MLQIQREKLRVPGNTARSLADHAGRASDASGRESKECRKDFCTAGICFLQSLEFDRRFSLSESMTRSFQVWLSLQNMAERLRSHHTAAPDATTEDMALQALWEKTLTTAAATAQRLLYRF